MNYKILFATNIPFWQTSTGAEQRIASLHRFLSKDEFCSKVFYLGQVQDSERDLIQRAEVDVVDNASHRPPEKLINRIQWYADATVNQARMWLNRAATRLADSDGPQSLTLDDYHWPWAVTKFAETVESYQPDAIIFEYIITAYLLNALSREQRERIVCLVDTHDVLHLRAQQFFEHGFPHWLKIDKDEEAEILNQFDVIMAIQEQEAELFSSIAPIPTTITAGHAVQAEAVPEFDVSRSESIDKITIGYIGSKNFSNWQAIQKFLDCAWPTVMSRHANVCELVIAGAICDWFGDDGAPEADSVGSSSDHSFAGVDRDKSSASATKTLIRENVRMLGRIDDVMEFYDQIDVVINPVEFGTGLKIKNAESLRYGKLLITTRNGFDGMPEATRLACKVVEDVDEMGLAINSICNDLSTIRPIQSLALQLAQTEFSETQAYSELKSELLDRLDRGN